MTDTTGAAPFSLSWRGYDRAEVDAFLARTVADRRRLQEDLAQLEAMTEGQDAERQRELERLAALRAELVRCLEASVNALHVANLLLCSTTAPAPEQPREAQQPPAPSSKPAFTSLKRRSLLWPPPDWLSPARGIALVFVTSAAFVITPPAINGYRAVQLQAAGLPVSDPLAHPVPAAPESVPGLVSAHELPGSAVPVAAPLSAVAEAGSVPPSTDASGSVPMAAPASIEPGDGLVLTLTALDNCWIRTTVDAGEPRERLLKPNDSITLRATDEAVLRIGDAAALRLTINDRPAKPLGTAGRVATVHITRTNFQDFVARN